MLLLSATVGPFRSIDKPQTVDIDYDITALVGMNEAGKTVFLRGLSKAIDVLGIDKFDPVEDFPRKDLPAYLKVHDKTPAEVTILKFQLTDDEVESLNKKFGTAIPEGFTFSLNCKYNNKRTVGIDIDEAPVVASLAESKSLSTDAAVAVKNVAAISEIPAALKAVSLTPDDQAFLSAVEARVEAARSNGWKSVIEYEAFQWLNALVPQFLYFGDYEILPSKLNLKDLATRVEQAKTEPKQLKSSHRGVLALLRMADISLTDFSNPEGYESLKAKIEGVSINLTDQVMEFWKQNENLEVEIDIRTDPKDQAPFNDGPNLYIRIKNRRHRGVSTPFGQRSRGFIWFFSFLVWFNDVKQQLAVANSPQRLLILLLDEPGLSLHALAQSDFLRYIDRLAEKHQVIYTTHSPFMIHSDRLHQVRTVEDKPGEGTLISSNISASDPRTIFPLQAALGWSIAQNLFISERNLLVEGPSELIYLQTVSGMLEAAGREGLASNITIVPTGGLDKVVTFVALLGASGLKLAVLHDYRGAPEQRLMDLVKDKVISQKAVLSAAHFRDLAKLGEAAMPTDIEDLFPVDFYLDYFHRAFLKGLGSTSLTDARLPKGDRIVVRLEEFLAEKAITLRPSGGFNHYLVAAQFGRTPPKKLDADTLKRFEALFRSVNDLLR